MRVIFKVFILVLYMYNCTAQSLKITEIMYNPPEAGVDTLEYLEIVNLTNAPYNLANHVISSGIVDTFLASETIPANGYFITAKSATSFKTVFGFDVHQWKGGSLNNDGEKLEISKIDGTIIHSVIFGNEPQGWPALADGGGTSMELCDLEADSNEKANWAESNNNTGLVINNIPLFASPKSANNVQCGEIVADHIVIVRDFSFTPSTITIKQGESVEWSVESGHHNINGSKNTFPSNPEGFFSGSAAAAPYKFSFVFNNVGTYNYQCDPHSGQMKGKVIVEPLAPPLTYKPTSISNVRTINTNGVSNLQDSLVEVSGVVYGYNTRTQGMLFTIIDDSRAGVGIFNSNNTFGYSVNENDKVKIRGKVSHFNGFQQILADTVIIENSGNTLFPARIITTLNEGTESDLIKIENLSLVDPSQWVKGATFNVNVTNGVQTFQMRVLNTTSLSQQDAPSGSFSATGLGNQFDNASPYTEGYQFIPRFKEDVSVFISNYSSKLDLGTQILPNPTQNVINIKSIVKIDQVEIFDLNGKQLKKQKTNLSVIDCSNLQNGTYLLKISDSNNSVFKRFIKI